jgi:uncharacterized protein (DUF433 family)
MKEYKNRIYIDTGIHFGKPCIVGTRIPVENVLELVQEALPFSKIIEDYYPELTVEDIKACLQYALDLVHSEDIRADIR